MNTMNVPTIKEICEAAKKHFERESCQNCPVKKECDNDERFSNFEKCKEIFLAAVIAKKINLDGMPISIEAKKIESINPIHPKWVEVGQWVFDEEDELFIITELTIIKGKYAITLKSRIDSTVSRIEILSNKLRPVRFRPYNSTEEALSIIGKILEYEDYNYIDKSFQLVTNIRTSTETGEVLVNDGHFGHWKTLKGKIDGIPIGVPVVDEELMN